MSAACCIKQSHHEIYLLTDAELATGTPERDLGRVVELAQLSGPEDSTIPVAITSAGADVESILAEARVTDFLKKPVDLGRVLEVVTKYCR